MLRHLRILLGSALLLVFQGCEAPLPATPPAAEQPDATGAFEAWQAIAATTPMNRDVEQAVLLTSTMAAAENGLAPLVAVLGDVKVSAEQKVFAIVCLTSQRDRLQDYEAPLLQWVATGQPAETRMLATHVLGLLKSPGAMATMDALLADSDRKVREAAMGVMLSFHPEVVADRLNAFWADPETSAAIRDQVVLGMPPHLVADFLPIYASAAVNLGLSEPARMRAISVLGQLGGPEHVAILEQCVAQAPEDAVKDHARGALALLQASTGPVAPATE